MLCFCSLETVEDSSEPTLLVAHWDVRETGAMETASGGKPGLSCYSLLLPGLQACGNPENLAGSKKFMPGRAMGMLWTELALSSVLL